jgi:hypothetical protein
METVEQHDLVINERMINDSSKKGYSSTLHTDTDQLPSYPLSETQAPQTYHHDSTSLPT